MSITIDSRGDFVIASAHHSTPSLNTSALTHDWVSNEVLEARESLPAEHPLTRRQQLTATHFWTLGLVLGPLTALAIVAFVWGKTPLAVAVPILTAFAAYTYAALTVWSLRPQWKRWIMVSTFANENDAIVSLTTPEEPLDGSLANRPFRSPLRVNGFASRLGRNIEVFTANHWTVVRIPHSANIPHLAVSANYNETTLRLRRALPRILSADLVPLDTQRYADGSQTQLTEFAKTHTLTVGHTTDAAAGQPPTPEGSLTQAPTPGHSASAVQALEVVSAGLLELLVDYAPDFDVEIVSGTIIFSAPVRMDLAQAPFWTLVTRFVRQVEAIEHYGAASSAQPEQPPAAGLAPFRERFNGKARVPRANSPALHTRERWWVEQSVPILGLAAVLSLVYTRISTLH